MAALFATKSASEVAKSAADGYASADPQEVSYKSKSCDDAFERCKAVVPIDQTRRCYEPWKTCEQTRIPTIFPGGNWVPSRPK